MLCRRSSCVRCASPCRFGRTPGDGLLVYIPTGGKTKDKLKIFPTLLMYDGGEKKWKNNINEELWLLLHEDDSVRRRYLWWGRLLVHPAFPLYNPPKEIYYTRRCMVGACIDINIHSPCIRFCCSKDHCIKIMSRGLGRNVFQKYIHTNYVGTYKYVCVVCEYTILRS